MEWDSDNPNPFKKKSSITWVSPANPWWVCLLTFLGKQEAQDAILLPQSAILAKRV